MALVVAITILTIVVIVLFSVCSAPRSQVRLIHLVLFSPGQPYTAMKDITRPLYHATTDVQTIYYCYDPSLTVPYHYDPSTSVLTIRGNETYVPGILHKTIDAFEFALTHFTDWTHLARSNVSSVIDLPKLHDELCHTAHPVDYGGFMINELAWIDPAGGVHDETWWGTRYASGTCILFSRERVADILRHRAFLRSDLVDDLSLGVYMREYRSNVKVWSSRRRDWLYRNRQTDRRDDLRNMKTLVETMKR